MHLDIGVHMECTREGTWTLDALLGCTLTLRTLMAGGFDRRGGDMRNVAFVQCLLLAPVVSVQSACKEQVIVCTRLIADMHRALTDQYFPAVHVSCGMLPTLAGPTAGSSHRRRRMDSSIGLQIGPK